MQPAEAAPGVTTEDHALALRAERIEKRFGGVRALEGADFALRYGEVHVLIGSNGCGKSTLCKIIAGALSADAGRLAFQGAPAAFTSPAEARAAGIATVYQETSLIPTLSVARNIVLGAEPLGRGGLVDGRAARARAVALLHGIAAPLAGRLDPDALVADLTVDQQQTVEIVKALGQEPRVILFDEATSSLDRAQVAAFFGIVRALRARGTAMIFISHRMDELFAIGDRVTVMRNGRTVACLSIEGTSKEEVVRLMVGGGEAPGDLPSAGRGARQPAGPVALDVRQLSGPRFRGVSLDLRRGEILGLGGLHGQGQSDLLLALFGAVPASGGEIVLEGVRVMPRSPGAAMRCGFAYVSGDRGRAGSFPVRSIMENLSVAVLFRRGWHLVRPAALRALIGPVVERLKLRFPGFAAPMSALSGGNQQKVILARWLATAPRVLLLDDPTKGIDVEAKHDLYELMGELCREGAAILFHSSDDAELLQIADRVMVFNGGRVVAELSGGRMTEYELNAASLVMA